MRRILVTAISGDIGNGILKILQETDAEVYGCDVNEYAAGMDKVRRFFVVPFAKEESYIPKMLQLCKEYEIKYLIPANEREIERISEQRESFISAGIFVVIQSERVLDICLDKYRCMQFLRQQQILVPDTWLATEDRAIRDRCILKPRKSNGSKNIKLLERGSKLTPVKKNEQNLIQTFIPGDQEYTAGIFSDGRTTNVITFRRKLKNGYSDFVELAELPEILQIAERIQKAFHLCGFLNVQLKEWNGKYYIFEINPRISGTVYFRHLLAYHDVFWWLDLIDKKEVIHYKCEYKTAIGLREMKEKFVEIAKNS